MPAQLAICSPITKEPMQAVVRTTGQECVVNKLNRVSTAAAAVALTLPQSYADDTCVVVEDSSGDANTNNITITGGANGQLINGEVSFVMSRARGAIGFVRDALSNQWSIAVLPRQLDGARVQLYTAADAKVWLASPPALTSLNYSQGDVEGGGASIELNGSNFTPASVAYFDGVAAATVSVTPTKLTCTLPAHAAGAVFVTAKNGGAESNPLAFEYWSPLDVDGAGTNLAGLTGLWRANGAGGYTFVNGGPGARSGTLIDAVAAKNASSAAVAPPSGAALGGHVPVQATPATGYIAKLETTQALSDFVAAGSFAQWCFTKTDNATNTFPDGGGTWAGCYLMSCGNPFGCHLGLTGQGFAPTTVGVARAVVYDGGIQAVNTAGTLGLNKWYLIQSGFNAGTLSIFARDLAAGTEETASIGGVGNIADRTTPMRLNCNANDSVFQYGPCPEFGVMNTLISGANRSKLILYGRQRYGI